jgi:hypothetical protein
MYFIGGQNLYTLKQAHWLLNTQYKKGRKQFPPKSMGLTECMENYIISHF